MSIMCHIGSIFVSLKKLSFFLTRRILYTKSGFVQPQLLFWTVKAPRRSVSNLSGQPWILKSKISSENSQFILKLFIFQSILFKKVRFKSNFDSPWPFSRFLLLFYFYFFFKSSISSQITLRYWAKFTKFNNSRNPMQVDRLCCHGNMFVNLDSYTRWNLLSKWYKSPLNVNFSTC